MKNSRIARELGTISVMIDMYCAHRHPGATPCADCADLLHYARERLDRCPFQEGKTTCAKCPVHCYRKDMRESVRTVMRYVGPRMVYRHPLMAMWHLVDSRREVPFKPDDLG